MQWQAWADPSIPAQARAGLSRSRQTPAGQILIVFLISMPRPAVACPDLLSSWWAHRSRPGHTRAEVILTGDQGHGEEPNFLFEMMWDSVIFFLIISHYNQEI